MSGLTFQEPGALALLIFLIPFSLLSLRAKHRGSRLIQSIDGSTQSKPSGHFARDILRLLALAFLILALARPGYAPQKLSTEQSGRDVVFALDVSRSMLATDTYPSRLEVAKQGVRDALQVLENQRVGLIIYGGSASILCPLTYDYDFVRYMLDKAYPRSVDFGGTTLQSAVEKAVDQVFISGREGVQDLVILTDGGDHDSNFDTIIKQLETQQVNTLMIGLGDPDTGSPIPIENENGESSFIKADSQIVYTKLEGNTLRVLSERSALVNYEAAETSPFHLGQLYLGYASGLPSASIEAEESVVRYKEAAFFFITLAAILLLFAERKKGIGMKVNPLLLLPICLALLSPSDSYAQGESFEQKFTVATEFLLEGRYEDAEELYSELYTNIGIGEQSVRTLAVLQFNQGICQLRSAQGIREQSPKQALVEMKTALEAFLLAKQSHSDFERAGYLIQQTYQSILDLRQQIEEAEAAQEAIQESIKQIIQKLEVLLQDQQRLRSTVIKNLNSNDTERLRSSSKKWQKQQTQLFDDGRGIEEQMQQLDHTIRSSNDKPDGTETRMTQPIEWIQLTGNAQEQASKYLGKENDYAHLSQKQIEAEKYIIQILEYLSKGDASDESTPSEEPDMDAEYDYSDEENPSMSSSSATEGDLASDSTMQSLPLPNYSAEDILLEEQQNQQFREQKREAANAIAVEKDY